MKRVRLRALLRALPEPPLDPDLDARILAAARASARIRPRATAWLAAAMTAWVLMAFTWRFVTTPGAENGPDNRIFGAVEGQADAWLTTVHPAQQGPGSLDGL